MAADMGNGPINHTDSQCRTGALGGSSSRAEALQLSGSAEGDLGFALIVLHPALGDAHPVPFGHLLHFVSPEDERDFARVVLQSPVPDPLLAAVPQRYLANRVKFRDG